MAGYQSVAQRNLACAIRIKERRRELGLTQAEVVDHVSRHGSRLSNQALSAIENGRRLAVGRLPDLALALDCSVTYLIGLTADPRRWQPDEPDARPGEPDARPGEPDARPGEPDARPGEPDALAAAPARTPDAPSRPRRRAAPDPAAPSRRNWILGPDVPDIPGELRARAYETDVATPSL